MVQCQIFIFDRMKDYLLINHIQQASDISLIYLGIDECSFTGQKAPCLFKSDNQ